MYSDICVKSVPYYSREGEYNVLSVTFDIEGLYGLCEVYHLSRKSMLRVFCKAVQNRLIYVLRNSHRFSEYSELLSGKDFALRFDFVGISNKSQTKGINIHFGFNEDGTSHSEYDYLLSVFKEILDENHFTNYLCDCQKTVFDFYNALLVVDEAHSVVI